MKISFPYFFYYKWTFYFCPNVWRKFSILDFFMLQNRIGLFPRTKYFFNKHDTVLPYGKVRGVNFDPHFVTFKK